MCALPSIFLAADASIFSTSGYSVTSVRSPHDLLGRLHAPAAPELVVLDVAALLGSGVGVLTALRTALSLSGATVLLLSDVSTPLTSWAAYAVGAHAAVLGPLGGAPLARLAELLLTEHASTRAVAATLRKEAAPPLSPR